MRILSTSQADDQKKKSHDIFKKSMEITVLSVCHTHEDGFKNTVLELLLWRKGIGGVLGMLGPRFDPFLAQWVKDPAVS